jgi:1-acyl-sn-glycerol-3-phosphate acyltransferase
VRQLIGSLLFTSILFASVAIYGLVAFLMTPFGYRCSYGFARFWARWMLASLELFCGLGYTVEGLENLSRDNTVLLMKHSSSWETIAQIQIFPRQTWVIKRELRWAPVLGWMLYFLKAIAINRRGGRGAVEQVIEQGRQRLEEGLWIVIFPEGTRVPAGETRRYGISGVLLAQAAGARPVVPVAHNAGDFWPRRGLLKKPGTVRVVIGAPIATAGREPRDVIDDVRRWIEARLREFAAKSR